MNHLKVLFILLFAINLRADVDPKTGEDLYSKYLLGKKAPETMLSLDVQGFIGPKPDIRGKFVLVEFGTTWCHHCNRMLPKLNVLQENLKDRLVIIIVGNEDPLEIETNTRNILGVPKFYQAYDLDRKMQTEVQVSAYPIVFLLDPNGVVRYQGFPNGKNPLTEQMLVKLFKAYLK